MIDGLPSLSHKPDLFPDLSLGANRASIITWRGDRIPGIFLFSAGRKAIEPAWSFRGKYAEHAGNEHG